jgi:hypothetical protein
VDGADSTEVWGAFRAARRARVRGVAAHSGPDDVTVEAAHDGFSRLGGQPIHRRHWRLSADGLRVDDLVTGTGRHAVAVRWHLAPASAVRAAADSDAEARQGGRRPREVRSAEVRPAGVIAVTEAGRFDVTVTTPRGVFDVAVSAPAQATLTVETRPVATGFERRTDAPVLICRATGVLPIRISTVMRQADDPGGPGRRFA